MDVDHQKLGVEPRIEHVERASVDRKIEPVVRQKAAVLLEKYNQLRLDVRGPLRGHLSRLRPGRRLPLRDLAAAGARSRSTARRRRSRSRPAATPASTSRRRTASSRTTSASSRACAWTRWRRRRWRSIPAVVETPAGPKIAIAESDIEDYPGLWLRGTGGPALTATFPPYPLEEKALERSQHQGHARRRLHRGHARHAHLSPGACWASRPPTRIWRRARWSTCWRARRASPTRRGFTPARSRGTGGTRST